MAIFSQLNNCTNNRVGLLQCTMARPRLLYLLWFNGQSANSKQRPALFSVHITLFEIIWRVVSSKEEASISGVKRIIFFFCAEQKYCICQLLSAAQYIVFLQLDNRIFCFLCQAKDKMDKNRGGVNTGRGVKLKNVYPPMFLWKSFATL